LLTNWKKIEIYSIYILPRKSEIWQINLIIQKTLKLYIYTEETLMHYINGFFSLI